MKYAYSIEHEIAIFLLKILEFSTIQLDLFHSYFFEYIRESRLFEFEAIFF